MRKRLLILAVSALILLQSGCAAGFHIGGERTGFGAGAALAHDPITTPTSSAR